MLSEIDRFLHWLRRKYPHSSTPIHYMNDLKLFFNWIDKPVLEIDLWDIDAYIEDCQKRKHKSTTINRRLAAIRALYAFLDLDLKDVPENPVIPEDISSERAGHCPRMPKMRRSPACSR